LIGIFSLRRHFHYYIDSAFSFSLH
jgi:hypothetical protein